MNTQAAPASSRDEAAGRPPESKDRPEQEVRSRLHPQVQNWLAEAGAGRRKGLVELEVWLADASKEVVERLRQLGFKTTKPSREVRRFVGTIPVEKLEALARLPEVLYVAPARP